MHPKASAYVTMGIIDNQGIYAKDDDSPNWTASQFLTRCLDRLQTPKRPYLNHLQTYGILIVQAGPWKTSLCVVWDACLRLWSSVIPLHITLALLPELP